MDEQEILDEMERQFPTAPDRSALGDANGWARMVEPDFDPSRNQVMWRDPATRELESRLEFEALLAGEQRVLPTRPVRPVQQRVIRSTRLDDGSGGGFPPIGPGHGGGRGRGDGARGRGTPLSLVLLALWFTVAAGWVVDSPEQRTDDLPFMMLIGIGFSAVALVLHRTRRL